MFTDMSVSGVVFLDKPLGWTSRRAVNEMMRLFSKAGKKRIKAGHGGTLDPLATGMLPILLGEATRFAELGLHAEKRYTVSFDLSYQTDTLDCEGDVLERFKSSANLNDIKTLIPTFVGEQQQVPPLYSAIRVNGKRAHAIAREGGDVVLAARSICIHRIELLGFDFPTVTLDVHCSKGTYIRSLARDIGQALGLGGCVTMLRRTSTGAWPEAMMVSMEQVQADAASAVLPLRQWLRDFSDIQLSEHETKRFLNGQRIQMDMKMSGDVVVMYGDILLGTACLKAGQHRQVLHPIRILPSAQHLMLNSKGSE
ncbi:MAG: tRNA pseudouridine(55) synthase TruB [Zetaproteobacteria bacterium]|nr:tRNA pseudouridine(55) synthase TruB [Zetaproteobacteria bacterium]